MSGGKKRRLRILGKIIFIIYIVFLVYFLIFSDWYGRDAVLKEYHYNFKPFQEIKRFWEYREKLGMWSVVNLLGNIAIFVPLGFIEPMASRERSFLGTILDGFAVSFLVEIFQFVSKVGRFDVDDLILNTLGVAIGYMVFGICNRLRRKHDAKRERT